MVLSREKKIRKENIDWIPACAGMTEGGNRNEIMSSPTLLASGTRWHCYAIYKRANGRSPLQGENRIPISNFVSIS